MTMLKKNLIDSVINTMNGFGLRSCFKTLSTAASESFCPAPSLINRCVPMSNRDAPQIKNEREQKPFTLART